MTEIDKLPLEYPLKEALSIYVERISIFLFIAFINFWVLAMSIAITRLSIGAWAVALTAFATYGIALGLWIRYATLSPAQIFADLQFFLQEQFITKGANMAYSSLREQFISIVQQVTREQSWPLAPSGISALVDAVLPIVSVSDTIDADQMRLIALNYYADGPAVHAMLTPGSATGDQLWDEWQTKMLNVAHAKGLTAQDAEDLVQSVFLHTRRALQNFQFKSRLQTYFFGIFNRQYAKWLQRETRWVTTDLEENPEAPPADLTVTHEGNRVENAEIGQLVTQEIQKIIKNQDFQILYWYYVETSEIDSATGQEKKWTDKNIGERLSMPTNTVTARRLRALARLRENSRLATLFGDLLGTANVEV